MNDVQENKVSMYLAVNRVLADNSSVWTTIVAFSDAAGLFGQKLDEIVGVVEHQETATTGVRADKLNAQDLMIERALSVGGAVFAYGSATNNQTLKESVDYTESDLKYVRDTISAERCTVIYTQATSIVADLADYGVTPAMLDELDERISDFVTLIPAPRVAITSRKGATSGLVDLIKEIDLVLKERLDKLMAQFKTTAPDFYTHYFNARLIAGARRNHDDDSDETNVDGETGTGDETNNIAE